jgi:hypothetical protein
MYGSKQARITFSMVYEPGLLALEPLVISARKAYRAVSLRTTVEG